MLKSIAATVILLAASFACSAETGSLSTADIRSEQDAIRAAIEADEPRYAQMPSVKRKQILGSQDRLFALIDGKASLAELNPDRRAEAVNLMGAISAAISNREDERLVCRRQATTGSLMVTRVCRSAAQIRAERAAARENMQVNQGICNSDVCVER